MSDIAFAQAVPGLGGPNSMMTLLPFILIFVIMYFMVIRPQQKKTKEHQELLNKLKKNDEVMTSGGMYGKVVALAKNVAKTLANDVKRVKGDLTNILHQRGISGASVERQGTLMELKLPAASGAGVRGVLKGDFASLTVVKT